MDKKYDSEVDIKTLSIADLYALYVFVSNDGNNRGFGMTSPEARSVVRIKQKSIEEELYMRAYGFDPFKEYQFALDKTDAEQLEHIVIVKGPNKEPEDEEPDRFIVVKNQNGEE